jgi:hypothetical protein
MIGSQRTSTNEGRRLTTAGLIAVTAATLLMMAWAIFPTPAVAQEVVPGNPDCGDLGLISLTKFEPVDSGTQDGVTITVDVDEPFFDWTSQIGIDAVIVKGGNNANVYHYDEATSDGGLHAPINPKNNQPFGLSHIEFCYDEDQPPEKGRIEVEKQTEPDGDSQVFNFNGPGSFDPSLSDGQFDGLDVDPGTYTVSETAPVGWTLTDITCKDSKDNNSTDAGNTATFNVEAGETVRCVFTNTKDVTTTTTPGGGGGGVTTTTQPPAPTTITTTSPTVAPTTIHTSTTTTDEVLPTTVTPGGTAFTGVENVVPIGAIALMLMTSGSGLLWAGSRRRRHDGSEDED